jgi:hypothetical protein
MDIAESHTVRMCARSEAKERPMLSVELTKDALNDEQAELGAWEIAADYAATQRARDRIQGLAGRNGW